MNSQQSTHAQCLLSPEICQSDMIFNKTIIYSLPQLDDSWELKVTKDT